MKTWRFTFKCEYFGAQAEFPFFVDADTYHDATILADAYVKEKFPIACEQDLATIKFEGLGIDPKDWGKSKRELREPCEICTTVEWETDSPYDRDKLISKKELARNVMINGRELLVLSYQVGFFCVRERRDIKYCPMCGRKLEV